MKINTQLMLFAVLGFFACFLFFEVILLVWKEKHSAEARKLASRLKGVASDNVYRNEISILRSRIQDSQSQLIKIIGWFFDIRELDILLLQSGKLWSVEQFTRYIFLFFVSGFVIGLVSGFDWIWCMLFGACASLLPLMHIYLERSKRLKLVEQQLPDAIDSMARSLKAGHSFQSAFKIVSDEFAEPLAGEFRISLEETNLGVPLGEAMLNLSRRVPITDLKFFVIAILIQRESGGNLAHVLTSMSKIIRDRFQLMRDISTLSAEGRTSAWVMWLMPVMIVPLMSAITPYYAKLLFGTEVGLTLLKIGFVLMIFAGLCMRKIIQIKV